jgi:hypothetical protein
VLFALLCSASAFWLGVNVFWLNASVVLASIAIAILLCGLARVAEVRYLRSTDQSDRSSAPGLEVGAAVALLLPLTLLALLGLGIGLVPPWLIFGLWLNLLGGYVLRIVWIAWYQHWSESEVALMIVLAGPLGLITFMIMLLDSCKNGSCL